VRVGGEYFNGLLTRFTHLFETADALHAAILDGKCDVVVDVARHIDKYLRALIRDQAHFINVGPVMDREEAKEPYAKFLGYINADDLDLATKMSPARVSPENLATLRELGVRTPEELAQAKRRMVRIKYAGNDADLSVVFEFLRDDAQGRKAGMDATQYRNAESKREAAAALAREQAAKKELAQKARDFPYVATLSCGMGGRHMNIFACFSGGSSGVDTELKITNGSITRVFKVYNLGQAGTSSGEGLHIDLRETFELFAQNSNSTLVLGLKIVDRLSGKVVYQSEAGTFGVLRVKN
jgi:hypothetical protein